MSKKPSGRHEAAMTWLTQFKERQARQRRNSLHLCYGSRCATHTAGYYAWTAGTAL